MSCKCCTPLHPDVPSPPELEPVSADRTFTTVIEAAEFLQITALVIDDVAISRAQRRAEDDEGLRDQEKIAALRAYQKRAWELVDAEGGRRRRNIKNAAAHLRLRRSEERETAPAVIALNRLRMLLIRASRAVTHVSEFDHQREGCLACEIETFLDTKGYTDAASG